MIQWPENLLAQVKGTECEKRRMKRRREGSFVEFNPIRNGLPAYGHLS